MTKTTIAMRVGCIPGIGLAVAALYLLACFLPCVDCGSAEASSSGDLDFDFERGHQYGLAILLFGCIGGNNGVAWSANVFLLFGFVCLLGRRLQPAVILGAIASVLGLTTWWVRRYDTLMIGYYVWQASQIVLVGGSMWVILKWRGNLLSEPEA